jgi:pyruvate formate lyase activating enzyme
MIADRKLGACKVRKNIGAKLYTLVYNHTTSQHVDPIEKKPPYHFCPGSTAFSIATLGCNFHCEWCQNWDIVQMSGEEGQEYGCDSTPGDIVSFSQVSDRHSIAYTYTEPIRQIWASSSNHSLFAFILWFAEDWLAFILTQLVRVVPNTNVAI